MPLFALGMVGLTWAEAVNKLFKPTIRIQFDRGQHVIDDGHYAWIRHPGSAAAFPFGPGMALALGSYWAIIPAVLFGLLLVLRTALEDRTLRSELPGYQDCAGRVRYRLVPRIW
ncbi:MAG: hypothetical protein U0800_11360 [Isosphaeraceae bacterium]